MFITNNHTLFDLCWQENLVKYQNVAKYCVYDYLQSFLSLFMFLLAAPIVKNSDILAVTYFIFLKNVLDQT